MEDDDGFEQTIHPDFQAPYRRDLRKLKGEKKNYYRKEADNLRDKLFREIEVAQSHDDIIDLCVHVFEETSMPTRRLGYTFEFADPLYENVESKPPIFDFLISKRQSDNPIVIFGEGKSRIAMSNIPDELADIDKKIDYVEKNLDKVKDLLGLKTNPILEYVLAVTPEMAGEVSHHIKITNRKIILWQADITNKFRLSLFRPRDETFEGRIHHDKELNRVLGEDGLASAVNVYGVFPLSHMFSKVALLIRSRNLVKNPYLVLTQILRQRVDSYLPTLDSSEKRELVQSIIDEGLRIDFIEPHEELNGAFRIKAKSRQEENLGSELRKCWVESRLEEAMTADFLNARNALQDVYRARNQQNPTLPAYLGVPEPPFQRQRRRRRRERNT